MKNLTFNLSLRSNNLSLYTNPGTRSNTNTAGINPTKSLKGSPIIPEVDGWEIEANIL
ncbi:MAG: hypothetical protein KME32_35025 [Mojavia pulchra JT2-VF2]|uniref:Uncharacterized protein n=1 Tax=Mojavia pulchra JT2-VF2 TaxID=287848 RepID=A0A951ULE8_9NOST|nr:hypothetical protein [Mojavia pulchra JT2-VF2]